MVKFSSKDYEKAVKYARKNRKQFEKALREYATKFLDSEYGIDFDIDLIVSARLTASMGLFTAAVSKDSYIRFPKNIKISEELIVSSILMKDNTALHSVLKHECIHYALCELGRDYRDGENDFENELAYHKVSSNYNNENLQTYVCRKFKHKCDCRDILHDRKLKNYHCTKCNADIEFVEVVGVESKV